MSDCAVTRSTVFAGQQQLEYAHWQSTVTDTTLVLLHEGLGCVELWRDFPAELASATGCNVLAYSRAGYGSSTHDGLPQALDYLTTEATNVLPTVLSTIDKTDVVLIGHSDGATIAAIYAGMYRDERLRAIVTMAPHFFTEPLGLEAIASTKNAFDSGDLKKRLAKYHQDAEHTFRGWNNRWLHPGFKRWNVSDVIDGIRVPVLAIQGLDDPYGTLAQIQIIEQRCHSQLDTFLIENCGHAPFLEHMQLVIGRIKHFLGLHLP